MKYRFPKEIEEALRQPTYYEQEEYIDLMTMLDGLICTKTPAISVSADGKETNKSGTEVNLQAEKIYELSEQCAVMFAGSVPGSINERMDWQHQSFEEQRVKDVTDIADRLVDSFSRSDQRVNGKLERLFAIVAGYDLDSDNYIPHLYLIQKQSIWGKQTFNVNYLHAGEAFDVVHDLLSTEFNSDDDLETMNRLALKAIKIAGEAKSEVTGGQSILWNIIPNQGIKKFTPEEIELLQ